jgi:hypothetical protein
MKNITSGVGAPGNHVALERGLKGDLYGLIRVAVTGKTVAPPLFESMEILGRERVLERLDAAVGKLGALVEAKTRGRSLSLPGPLSPASLGKAGDEPDDPASLANEGAVSTRSPILSR